MIVDDDVDFVAVVAAADDGGTKDMFDEFDGIE